MNARLLIAGALSLVALTAGCSSTETKTESDTSVTTGVGENAAAANLHGKIESEVHQQFRGNTLASVKFDVDANGSVTISGSVSSAADKNAIAAAVAGVDGVVNVTNDLTVEATADLKGTVEASLHKQFPGDMMSKVRIDTDASGTVTLTGSVATQKDKDAIANAVVEIEGVSDLKNNLTVSSSTSSSSSSNASTSANSGTSASADVKANVGRTVKVNGE